MKITLPSRRDSKVSAEITVERSLVIFGANGAGKSKFGKSIHDAYKGRSLMLSALHSLYYIKEKGADEEVEGSKDFDSLITEVLEEEYTSALHFKESYRLGNNHEPAVTKLDRLQEIWTKVLPYSHIVVRGSRIEVINKTSPDIQPEMYYKPNNMSEGEKIIFYFICSVLFAKHSDIIVVDEPEMHLHRSVMHSLWDILECEREDCTFIYLTNDLSFASSRRNSKPIWVKSYDAVNRQWEYEVLKQTDSFPQETYLEVLGSRKPILFIEGNETSSIDIHLYPNIFPEYNVKPLGGCTRVIESTKAINGLKSFHLLEAKGIVDRDRRTDDEVGYLRHHNIYVPNVAEVENLLMLPDVIREVSTKRGLNAEAVFASVCNNLISQFEREIPEQAMLHVRHRIRRMLELSMDKKTTDINEYEKHIYTFTHEVRPKQMYQKTVATFRQYAEEKNYTGILKVYNQKSMLNNSRLYDLLNVSNLNQYLSIIISILNENNDSSTKIRKTIKQTLGILS